MRSQSMGLLDLLMGSAGAPKKAAKFRHNGRKLSEILEAHAKFHLGHAGGARADLSCSLRKLAPAAQSVAGERLAGSPTCPR